GTLTLLTNSVVSRGMLNGEGCAWGDYDNDGWLDLCVGNFYGENNSLFHNNRDGTFTKITNSIVALDGGTTKGVAWGDYDNDGWQRFCQSERPARQLRPRGRNECGPRPH